MRELHEEEEVRIVRFTATADTDIGINKTTNQDSMLIKHAVYEDVEILMAIICDGMGGLAKGELASATVIRTFSDWFRNSLPFELENLDIQIIGEKWILMLKDLNARIMEYGETVGEKLGTTFSGMLMIDSKFLILHVGDSRIYHIGSNVIQLTTDQTFVEREVVLGNLTPEQAKTDKRRNLLLQCIGASSFVNPQIINGDIESGVYMLCSDGFRHTITENEMLHAFHIDVLRNKTTMHKRARQMIDIVKSRNEKDNISVLVIKVNDSISD